MTLYTCNFKCPSLTARSLSWWSWPCLTLLSHVPGFDSRLSAGVALGQTVASSMVARRSLRSEGFRKRVQVLADVSGNQMLFSSKLYFCWPNHPKTESAKRHFCRLAYFLLYINKSITSFLHCRALKCYSAYRRSITQITKWPVSLISFWQPGFESQLEWWSPFSNV